MLGVLLSDKDIIGVLKSVNLSEDMFYDVEKYRYNWNKKDFMDFSKLLYK